MIFVAILAFVVLFALFVVVPTQVQKRHRRQAHEHPEQQADQGRSEMHQRADLSSMPVAE